MGISKQVNVSSLNQYVWGGVLLKTLRFNVSQNFKKNMIYELGIRNRKIKLASVCTALIFFYNILEKLIYIPFMHYICIYT